jgi:hypothetical protein
MSSGRGQNTTTQTIINLLYSLKKYWRQQKHLDQARRKSSLQPKINSLNSKYLTIALQPDLHVLLFLFQDKDLHQHVNLFTYFYGISKICSVTIIRLLLDRLRIGVSYDLPAIQAILAVNLENLGRTDFALATEKGAVACNSFLFFGLAA